MLEIGKETETISFSLAIGVMGSGNRISILIKDTMIQFILDSLDKLNMNLWIIPILENIYKIRVLSDQCQCLIDVVMLGQDDSKSSVSCGTDNKT